MSDPDVPDAEILAALVPEHLIWLEAKGYAASTVTSRSAQLRRFVRWCEARGLTRPTELTLPVLERYRLHLFELRKRDGLPLGRGAQTQYLLAVKGLLRWLTLTRRIRSNPGSELELPKQSYRIPRSVLTAAEAERVLAGPDTAHPLGVRDRAILELLYSTGVRRAELCGLALSDLEPSRQALLVREGKGRRDRVVPVGERALHWVMRYLTDVRPLYVVPPEPDALFIAKRGGPLEPKALSRLVRRYVERAEVPKSGSCHLFRHTMATLMLEGGADVRHIQAILGHAELSTTALYTRVSITQLVEVHRRTHPAQRDAQRDAQRALDHDQPPMSDPKPSSAGDPGRLT